MDYQIISQDQEGSESGDPTGQPNSSSSVNDNDSKFTPVKSGGLQKLNKSFTFEGSLKSKTSSKSKMVEDLMKSATDTQRFIAW